MLAAAISQVVVQPDSTAWWQAAIGPLVGAGLAGLFLLAVARGDRREAASGRSEERAAVRANARDERLAVREAERDAYQRDVARALIGLVTALADAEKRFEVSAEAWREAREMFEDPERRQPWLDRYDAANTEVVGSLIPVAAKSEELSDRDVREKVNVFVTTVTEAIHFEHRLTTPMPGAAPPTEAEVAAVTTRLADQFGEVVHEVAKISRS